MNDSAAERPVSALLQPLGKGHLCLYMVLSLCFALPLNLDLETERPEDAMMREIRKQIRKRRVFLIGAGFSASAGVPLTDRLLHMTMEKFKKECPGIYERIERYTRECFSLRANQKIDFKRISFSDLCTFLEFVELREYGGGERWNDMGSREKLALKFYLAKTVVENTPSRENIPELYQLFVQQLRPGDVILSFNWDCLLEHALKAAGVAYAYRTSLDAVGLIKMHGSVNWQIGNKAPFKDPGFKWQSLNFGSPLRAEVFSAEELTSYANWDGYGPLTHFSPFLVLPGYGKAFDVRWIAGLWYKTESLFGFTHDVYVIGLSLAHDDFFVRSFFTSSLPDIHCYSGVPGRKITVINPDKNLKKNYSFLKGTKGAEFINEKLKVEHILNMR